MRFPTISDVAAELRNINKQTLEPDDADEGIDVRLQVYPDGQWAVRWGSSDYDQDHRGFWGAASVPGNNRRFSSTDVARDLIDQAREHKATGGGGEFDEPKRAASPRGRVQSRKQPSLPGYPDIPEKITLKDIAIPNMPMWEQIDGDMDPGTYGGTIARSEGNALELLKIQPVREYIGDKEAADVGFPFWTREAYFTLEDLDPENDDVKSALNFIGMDSGEAWDFFVEKSTPEQRALTIASALLDYGRADEGPAGWSDDIIHDKVKWHSGKVEGSDYLSDEDDAFAREVILEDLDIDVEAFNRDENPTSGYRVKVSGTRVEITEWQDIEDATGEEAPEGEKILRTDTETDLSDLIDPKAKHRGTYGGDKAATLRELAQMDDKEREDVIVKGALSYIAYFGGNEDYVEYVGR